MARACCAVAAATSGHGRLRAPSVRALVPSRSPPCARCPQRPARRGAADPRASRARRPRTRPSCPPPSPCRPAPGRRWPPAAGSSAAPAPPRPGGTAAELRLGLLRQRHPRRRAHRRPEGPVHQELGATKLTTQVFNAGPAEVEALFAGALDAAYIGPSPAINAYGQSDGDAIRIIAGAASGGAELVVRDGINSAADLKGKTLASPQLGNTQDVALRTWLTAQGLKNSVTGGGDVTIDADQATPTS